MTNLQRVGVLAWCLFWFAVLGLSIYTTTKFRDGFPLGYIAPLSVIMLLVCRDYVDWLKNE